MRNDQNAGNLAGGIAAPISWLVVVVLALALVVASAFTGIRWKEASDSVTAAATEAESAYEPRVEAQSLVQTRGEELQDKELALGAAETELEFPTLYYDAMVRAWNASVIEYDDVIYARYADAVDAVALASAHVDVARMNLDNADAALASAQARSDTAVESLKQSQDDLSNAQQLALVVLAPILLILLLAAGVALIIARRSRGVPMAAEN